MENKEYSHLLGVAMLLGLFLPHISTALMAINPLMLLMLYYINRKKSNTSFSIVKLFLCTVIFISFFYSFITVSHESDKYIFSSVFLMMLIMFFPFTGPSQIHGSYFFFAIGFILFTQLIYLFNLPSLQKTLEMLYPVEKLTASSFEYMTENISSSNIFNFRLGGVFRNANQSARFTCLITAVYLADRHNESLRKTGLYLLLAFISVLLTGSRTGLVVFSLIIFVFLYRNHSIKRNLKVALVLLVMIAIVPSFFTGSTQFRGFNVSQGFNDSANVKWYVLMDYLSQHNSAFHLLFGYGDVNTFQPSKINIFPIFDSEYGELIYTYGFVGFILVIIFYIKSIRICRKENRLFFIILLWAITSTILLSYRMSFLFMLFLSHFVSLNNSSRIQYQ